MITVLGFRAKWDPTDFDLVLDVTSRDKQGRELSPFTLGPIKTPAPFRGAARDFGCVENLWQYSKVYDQLGHLDGFGNLTDNFREWWETGSVGPAVRYPVGRRAKPEFSVYGKHRIGYLTARRLIYIPAYSMCARRTSLFRELCSEYKRGAKILLLDFDGYSRPVSMQTAAANTAHAMGHAYVLRACIENMSDPEWYAKQLPIL